jgi:hypothetical protein
VYCGRVRLYVAQVHVSRRNLNSPRLSVQKSLVKLTICTTSMQSISRRHGWGFGSHHHFKYQLRTTLLRKVCVHRANNTFTQGSILAIKMLPLEQKPCTLNVRRAIKLLYRVILLERDGRRQPTSSGGWLAAVSSGTGIPKGFNYSDGDAKLRYSAYENPNSRQV